MTLLEKIESWIIPNTSRSITAYRLREILIEIVAGISVDAEETTGTWNNAAGEEYEISHSLATTNVDVHIYIADGTEKINPSAYRVFPTSSETITVVKDVIGVWADAKIIVKKLV